MIVFLTVIVIVGACTALPYTGIDTQNVITVPPNCPPGYEWINGQCREVWRSVTAAPSNVITVPPNCPPGQQWVNGQCRDVWPVVGQEPKNVVTVPSNCRPGQQWINGQCRDIWFRFGSKQDNLGSPYTVDGFFNRLRNNLLRKERQVDYPENEYESENRNVINVPNQCPAGYRPDANGFCRPMMQ